MPPTKKTTAAKKTAPYRPPTPPAEGSAPGPGTGDPSAQTGSRGESDAKQLRSRPRVAAGDVVALAPTEDTPEGAPATHVLVVDRVAGTEHRDDGALIVPLPEARWVPLSALATD